MMHRNLASRMKPSGIIFCLQFGTPFNEIRYNKGAQNHAGGNCERDLNIVSSVIKQCTLEHDLELFEAGDETEVSERGLTLR